MQFSDKIKQPGSSLDVQRQSSLYSEHSKRSKRQITKIRSMMMEEKASMGMTAKVGGTSHTPTNKQANNQSQFAPRQTKLSKIELQQAMD